MTSNAETVIFPAGVLDEDSSINPQFAGANLVWCKYCSSDVWVGAGGTIGAWSFNGRYIVKAVMEDLISSHGLPNTPSTNLLIAGDSAGGVGAQLNIDFLKTTYFNHVNRIWGE